MALDTERVDTVSRLGEEWERKAFSQVLLPEKRRTPESGILLSRAFTTLQRHLPSGCVNNGARIGTRLINFASQRSDEACTIGVEDGKVGTLTFFGKRFSESWKSESALSMWMNPNFYDSSTYTCTEATKGPWHWQGVPSDKSVDAMLVWAFAHGIGEGRDVHMYGVPKQYNGLMISFSSKKTDVAKDGQGAPSCSRGEWETKISFPSGSPSDLLTVEPVVPEDDAKASDKLEYVRLMALHWLGQKLEERATWANATGSWGSASGSCYRAWAQKWKGTGCVISAWYVASHLRSMCSHAKLHSLTEHQYRAMHNWSGHLAYTRETRVTYGIRYFQSDVSPLVEWAVMNDFVVKEASPQLPVTSNSKSFILNMNIMCTIMSMWSDREAASMRLNGGSMIIGDMPKGTSLSDETYKAFRSLYEEFETTVQPDYQTLLGFRCFWPPLDVGSAMTLRTQKPWHSVTCPQRFEVWYWPFIFKEGYFPPREAPTLAGASLVDADGAPSTPLCEASSLHSVDSPLYINSGEAGGGRTKSLNWWLWRNQRLVNPKPDLLFKFKTAALSGAGDTLRAVATVPIYSMFGHHPGTVRVWYDAADYTHHSELRALVTPVSPGVARVPHSSVLHSGVNIQVLAGAGRTWFR
jgi:hypothetical protein